MVRDTIKREALRKAGVGYLEVFEDDGDDEIRTRLRQHLARMGNPVPADTARHQLQASIVRGNKIVANTDGADRRIQVEAARRSRRLACRKGPAERDIARLCDIEEKAM